MEVIGEVIGSLIDALSNGLHVLRAQTPGGFGLLVLPLAILGIVSLLVARRR